jgi:hypothetical protein
MDILNDQLHSYPPNPAREYTSDSEESDNNRYVETLQKINNSKKRKNEYTFDDWCMVYSDELWHLWCIISEFKKGSNLLDKMNYPGFCDMCYQNSTKC